MAVHVELTDALRKVKIDIQELPSGYSVLLNEKPIMGFTQVADAHVLMGKLIEFFEDYRFEQ